MWKVVKQIGHTPNLLKKTETGLICINNQDTAQFNLISVGAWFAGALQFNMQVSC